MLCLPGPCCSLQAQEQRRLFLQCLSATVKLKLAGQVYRSCTCCTWHRLQHSNCGGKCVWGQSVSASLLCRRNGDGISASEECPQWGTGARGMVLSGPSDRAQTSVYLLPATAPGCPQPPAASSSGRRCGTRGRTNSPACPVLDKPGCHLRTFGGVFFPFCDG